MANYININGQSFEVSGSNVSITNGTVYVDGKEIINDLKGIVEIKWEGEVANINSQASVSVAGNVQGDIAAGGSISCGDILTGNAKANGSITCSDIHGDAKAGGSIKCNNIKGSAKAGGSIKVNNV